MTRRVRLHRLGMVPYRDAWDWQRATAAAVREGAPEAIALLQHPPVYSFGRRVRPEHLVVTPRDAEVVESDRGGDITYHGPGQLVAYPILDLRRRNLGAADYVRCLEEVMIRAAAAFGVPATRVHGRPGVWTATSLEHRPDGVAAGTSASSSSVPLHPGRGTRACPEHSRRASSGEAAKLGAVGVRVQGGVTTHGLALNVSTDLSRFEAIVPCGLHGVSVTSMQRELGHAPVFEAVEAAFVEAFEATFDCSVELASEISALHHDVPSAALPGGEGRAPVLSQVGGTAG